MTSAESLFSAVCAFAILFPIQSYASSDTAGKAIAIGLPVFAGGVTLLHDWDWRGVKQLAFNEGVDIATVLVLKQLVHEQRPDHSNFQSFPSLTTGVAAGSAAYLWDRYGWEYGAPAYLATAYVGYSVVDAKEHHWWDALASVGIAWGWSQLITDRWHEPGFDAQLDASPEGGMVRVSYKW
jgi:hypothetical protein